MQQVQLPQRIQIRRVMARKMDTREIGVQVKSHR